MNPNHHVVNRGLRLGPLRQLHPGRSRSLVRYYDRLHYLPPDVWDVDTFRITLQMSANRTDKLDGPMTFGYGLDAIDTACKNQRRKQTSVSHANRPAVTIMMIGRSSPLAGHLHGGRLSFISAFDPSGAAHSFGHGTEQGPRIECDRALREGRHHIWGEPDVLDNRIESRSAIGWHLFRL
jgi:hypothetical protein